MKPFDQSLYDQDDNAKFVVIEYLESLGFTAWVNPDDYGIDILADLAGHRYEIEVEVKHNWSGPHFPFPTLHYSIRKFKFLNSEARVRFITLNHEWSHAGVVTGEDLLVGKIINKETKYTKHEAFMTVPTEKVRWIQLANL